MRPFGGFEKDRTASNGAAKRGGMGVINNGFMGERAATSAGGAEGKGGYFRSGSLAGVGGAGGGMGGARGGGGSLAALPAGPNFLLSTLTRDAQAIRDERAVKGRATPSPGPPGAFMGGPMSSHTGLPGSASSLGGLDKRESPADRNRTVRATVGASGVAGAEGGGVVVGRSGRIRSVGNVGGGGGMDTLLPRVGAGGGAGASSLRGSATFGTFGGDAGSGGGAS
jgi:hypothetical protein